MQAISGLQPVLAALLAAGIVWVGCGRGVVGRLRKFALSSANNQRQRASVTLPATLTLELLAAALGDGASVPRALIAVGDVVSGATGDGLRVAGQRLLNGSLWTDAWVMDGSLAAGERRTLQAVRDCLRAPWERGTQAVPQIRAMIEQLDTAERADLEQRASRLSVNLLVPTALCFLPAFICIAVIPTIAAMIN
ncbi:hypothetical protein [Bifidobacterium gallicum]|uniref:Putative integral membrane protein n=1 Tax=Bifidobacterium gallicum DSM 20093 = LMG 11596 TaxID=561180 RepID=D1NVX8_9BIFI|nr:hypothetical protein [Bifidobacterium gallicum]EFA22264.1 hypothetical protein BIFGAL_04022 [Bifidobacterium gallicum DSM 20093 = LMG 11596]KFI59997.1 putative integral membrane protein [Bifidobacterium gallicum DSM 20093 = LMG 11596]